MQTAGPEKRGKEARQSERESERGRERERMMASCEGEREVMRPRVKLRCLRHVPKSFAKL